MAPYKDPLSLDALLAQVSRLHYLRAHEQLEAIGLHRGQPPVLLALREREGQTHKELAERMHVTPATMSRMIQRMEKAGFVVRRADPEDQRVSRVFLTDAGRAVQSELRKVHRTMEEDEFSGFTEEERTEMRQYLLRVRDNLLRATGKECFASGCRQSR